MFKSKYVDSHGHLYVKTHKSKQLCMHSIVSIGSFFYSLTNVHNAMLIKTTSETDDQEAILSEETGPIVPIHFRQQ